MARELPPEQSPRRNRYIQWSRYDNGRPWELCRPDDFDRDPQKAALALRQWSYNHGRKVDVQVFEDCIRFLIHPPANQ